MALVWDGWAPVNVRIGGPALACETSYALKAMRRLPLAVYIRQMAEYSARYRHLPAVPATVNSSSETDQNHEPELACWFSCDGVILPSHWPFGVIADLLGSTPPWSLSCNFECLASAPAYAIPVAEANSLANDVFINSLKESVYIRTGSASPVLSLSRKHTELLLTSWGSAQSSYTPFKGISSHLASKTIAIPVKVYRENALLCYTQSVQSSDFVQGSQPSAALQSPFVRAPAPADADMTIGQYLFQHAPDQFPSPRAATDFRAVLHGVTAPLSAPLKDLLEFAYPDGFLHISVTPK